MDVFCVESESLPRPARRGERVPGLGEAPGKKTTGERSSGPQEERAVVSLAGGPGVQRREQIRGTPRIWWMLAAGVRVADDRRAGPP